MNGEWIALGGLAITILAQGIAVAFYMGRLAGRVASNAEAIATLTSSASMSHRDFDNLDSRVTVLETTIKIELGHFRDALSAVVKGQEGMSRQMAALVTKDRKGVKPPLADAMSDE